MNIARAQRVTADAVPESRTRERVLTAISRQGPITTTALAKALELSDTAIRRHVDNLVDAGLIEPHESSAAPRRRGRPAKAYVVSQAGHDRLAHDYDDVATAALRYVRDTFGEGAVADFAQQRAQTWVARYAAQLTGDSPGERAESLVAALTRDGYDATVRRVGVSGEQHPLTGLQLCQGHCPMQQVAAQFPQFCEAETESFSKLLGVHVQRLATLAQGDHVCTTFIPLPLVPATSGSDHPHHAEAS